MLKKNYIRILSICLYLILILLLIFHPFISDYHDYYTFLGNSQESNDSTLYVSLVNYVDGSLQSDNIINLQLTQTESAIAYNIIEKIENPHLIRKREIDNNTTCMRMRGSRVPYAFLCPDYFMVGTNRRIFAASDSYPEIYKELRSYFLTLNPQTHIPDRPI